MNQISLHRQTNTEVTIIQNSFIDRYMPRANGEYVKLYLYLLRLSASGQSVSIEKIAEVLEHTENDIRRALIYWSKQNLLELTMDSDKQIHSISFLHVPALDSLPQGHVTASSQNTGMPDGEPLYTVYTEPETGASVSETAVTQEPPKKPALTADRIAALKNQEEIEQLLFIASQYLGKRLSPAEISNILYFYDTLHFSTDLIEYLIEHCVSKGSKSCRYIEKVALEWSKEGIATVEEAKRSSSLYNKKYYAVLNAFGIKGRGPGQLEIEYIDRWINEFHFTMDIISEACNRTIAQISQPNFQYANKILEEWQKKGIKHLSDIQALDLEHLKNKKAAAAKPKPNTNNKFNNFHQRDYDFDELEKQLLNS